MSEKKPDSETTEERLSEKISIQTEEIKAEIQDKRESAEDTAEPSAAEPENAEETKSAEETGSGEFGFEGTGAGRRTAGSNTG